MREPLLHLPKHLTAGTIRLHPDTDRVHMHMVGRDAKDLPSTASDLAKPIRRCITNPGCDPDSRH